MQRRRLMGSFARIIALALVLALGVSVIGCAKGTFDITVRNQLALDANILLDGTLQGVALIGGELVIEEVSKAHHVLQAQVRGYEVMEKEVDVQRDVIWTLSK